MRELARRMLPLRARRAVLDMILRSRKHRQLRRARRTLRKLSRRGHVVPTSFGVAAPGAQPVIMCLWHRPDRFEVILDELAQQELDCKIELLLWNNEPGNDELYRDILARGLRGAVSQVQLFSSPVNVGGAGRMLAADALKRKGYRGAVVMIDDDQRVAPSFVRTLRDAWSEHSYVGVWAWRIHGDYWDRSAAGAGQCATYVGTGGSIVDVSLLTDTSLRSALDSADLMLEDLLLSWRAHQLGFRVIGSDAPFDFVVDEHAQWHALAEEKPTLYARLGRFAPLPRDGDTEHRLSGS